MNNELTLNFTFRQAMVCAFIIKALPYEQSFALLSMLAKTFQKEDTPDTSRSITITTDDIIMIFGEMGQQQEHFFSDINNELKESLTSQLAPIIADTNNVQNEAATNLATYMQQQQADIDAQMTNIVTQSTILLWPS